MLRITIHESAKERTIQLEGKLVGPWVEEFSRVWNPPAPALGSRDLCLDLRGVAFIDAQGRQLLREIYRQANAHFRTNSPLTQYYAEDAMHRGPQNGAEGA